jgi:hypothetical protein
MTVSSRIVSIVGEVRGDVTILLVALKGFLFDGVCTFPVKYKLFAASLVLQS